MVEPIVLLSREERIKRLKKARYNLFFLDSPDVAIDFLTDSGTGAMSENQWAGLMQGDESYAGSTSFTRLKKAVQKILGFPFVIPVHQGRGAESVFNKVLLKKGDVIAGNTPFDTTRAHIENRGAKIIDVTRREAFSEKSRFGFKGNVDAKRLERALSQNKGKILENAVFVELKRRNKEAYYYSNKNECDFIIKGGTRITEAIQVCYVLDDASREREINGLLEAMDKFKLKEGIILTREQTEEITRDGKKIQIMPVFRWLVE